MSSLNKIAVVLEMIESAQASLRSAKAMLSELSGISPAAVTSEKAQSLTMGDTPGGKVIEGVFDGQNMIGPDKRTYPVPANYASKSKLVQGDVLKLTITDGGTFIYKQIGPIPRRSVVGTVAFEDGLYKIVCEGATYRVLMASITFYKAEVGQRLSILLPEGMEAEWATIDNMLPDLPPGEALAEGMEPMPEEEAVEEAAPKPKRTRKKAAE